jgi:hypothetical protein
VSKVSARQAKIYHCSAQYNHDSIDFLVSENSMGFHADQYSITEFAEAINTCRQGQLALRRDVKSVSVQFPSIPETQLGQRAQNGN